jgi:hypothetical protein
MVYHMSNQELASDSSELTPFVFWEASTNRFARHMYGADGQVNVPHREWLVMFDRVINEVKAEMVELDRPNDFIGAKVSSFFQKVFSIYLGCRLYTLRFDPLHQMNWTGIWRTASP